MYREDLGDVSPSRTRGAINQIQDILKDEGGKGTIRNRDLQQKTENVQKEFEQLMNEIVSRRSGGNIGSVVPKVDDLLDGYYMPGPERKHRSPTKRLINHKNSTVDHKKRIQTGI